MTEIFVNKAQDRYNTLVGSINENLKKYQITHKSTPSELEKIKLEAYTSLWVWPSIEINEDPVNKDFEDLALTRTEARDLLGNYSFSSKDSSVSATRAYYVFSFIGDFAALNTTVNYNRMWFRIKRLNPSQIELSIYGQGDRTAVAASAKQLKGQFLSLIKSNQKELNDFIDTKANSFKLQVDLKIDNMYELAVKKNEDKELL